MVEGYIVYESLYYPSEYIKKINDTPRVVIWDDQLDEDKSEVDLLQTNGKSCMIKRKSLIFCQIRKEPLFTLKLIIYIWSHTNRLEFLYTSWNSKIDSINKFVLYNVEAMQPWVTLYEEKRREWVSDKKAFKKLNGGNMPYPDYLKENKPKICPNNWVVDHITKNMACSIVTCW